MIALAAVVIMVPTVMAHADPKLPCTGGAVDLGKCLINPGGTLLDTAAGAAAKSAADSGVGQMASAMFTGWDQLMKQFLTAWIHQGMLIDLDGLTVTWLTSVLRYLSIFLATIGLMLAGVWTMVHQRGEKAVQAAKGLFWVVLVAGGGSAFMQVLLPAGDAFGKWILGQANISTTAGLEQTKIVADFAGIAIVGGLIGILATLFQWGLMIVRAVTVPLLVAIWPTAAASSIIEGASAALPKVTTWLFAFILYKPAAAIVYAFAWQSKNENGIKGVLNGLVLTILAVFALPALIRLIAPAAAKLGSAAGGLLALSTVGAMAGAAASLLPAAGAGARAAGQGGQQISSTTRDSSNPGGGSSPDGAPLAPGSGPGGGTSDAGIGSTPSASSGSGSGGSADGGSGAGQAAQTAVQTAGRSSGGSGGGSPSSTAPSPAADSSASGGGSSAHGSGSAPGGESGGSSAPVSTPAGARSSAAGSGAAKAPAGPPGGGSLPAQASAQGSQTASSPQSRPPSTPTADGAGARAARELGRGAGKRLAAGAQALDEAIDGGDGK